MSERELDMLALNRVQAAEALLFVTMRDLLRDYDDVGDDEDWADNAVQSLEISIRHYREEVTRAQQDEGPGMTNNHHGGGRPVNGS
jgi:hypothetical protein